MFYKGAWWRGVVARGEWTDTGIEDVAQCCWSLSVSSIVRMR